MGKRGISLPDELLAKLEESAKAGFRSFSAEIRKRIEWSYKSGFEAEAEVIPDEKIEVEKPLKEKLVPDAKVPGWVKRSAKKHEGNVSFVEGGGRSVSKLVEKMPLSGRVRLSRGFWKDDFDSVAAAEAKIEVMGWSREECKIEGI